jgi:hypothetical protein
MTVPLGWSRSGVVSSSDEGLSQDGAVDVGRWLAEQGLGHLAGTLEKNGIAGDVLAI